MLRHSSNYRLTLQRPARTATWFCLQMPILLCLCDQEISNYQPTSPPLDEPELRDPVAAEVGYNKTLHLHGTYKGTALILSAQRNMRTRNNQIRYKDERPR